MRTLIIAEAGVNHNGDIRLAKKLVKVAAKAGADFVKFQTFVTENLVTKKLKKANYQIKNTKNRSQTQYDMLKKLELNFKHHKILINECKKNKIKFLSTPFDNSSIQLLTKLKMSYFKISSGDIDNLPFLRLIAKKNKKIFLSTGMSNLNDVKNAVKILIQGGTVKSNITILHCNTSYPTPINDVNLNAMKMIGKKLNIKYGYSDHTLGTDIPIAAVAMGASVIEKHFTIDRNMPGPDHAASLEPKELIEMVKSIKNVEKSFGNKNKIITKSERKNLPIAKKSIVAKKNIKKGEKFDEYNICVKRPGIGLKPMLWDKIINKKAKKNFKIDELIKL